MRILLLLGLSLLGSAVLADDKVTFATNWKAQAAHGGFYQAVADGTYKKFGLDVTIQQGGPQVNNRPLLPAGRLAEGGSSVHRCGARGSPSAPRRRRYRPCRSWHRWCRQPWRPISAR